MKGQGLGLTPGQGDYNQVTRPSAVSVAHSKVLTQVSSQASCGQKSPISFFFFFLASLPLGAMGFITGPRRTLYGIQLG